MSLSSQPKNWFHVFPGKAGISNAIVGVLAMLLPKWSNG